MVPRWHLELGANQRGDEVSWVDAVCSSLSPFSRNGHSAQLAQGIHQFHARSGHGGSADGGAERV